MIYGQQEVVKDLIAARLAARQPLYFEVDSVSVHDFETDSPRVRYRIDGNEQTLECDFIAGCDGFHGVCRASIPSSQLSVFERVYPFAWLGILAEMPPASEELIYANDDRGFALLSMRSPTVSRLYLQCTPDEDVEEWSDAQDLGRAADPPARTGAGRPGSPEVGYPDAQFRSGAHAFRAPVSSRRCCPHRAADRREGDEPRHRGRTGPGTGLQAFYREGITEGLDTYSSVCLSRVWKVQRFSWWMTSLLHRFDDETPFDHRRQLAELEYIVTSRAAAQSLAENYVGLPR